jgi:FkbM family methyltransferase
MLVHTGDAYISHALITTGHFGEVSIDSVLQIIESNARFHPNVFVDVGANIGTHTIHALRSGRFSTAISIEPEPRNTALLRANLLLNGLAERAVVHAAAAASRNGWAVLELSPDNFGDHRTRTDDMTNEAGFGEHARATLTVPAVRLGDVLRDVEGDVLLWVDAQGAEGDIVDGLDRRTNDGCTLALVMEFWPYGLRRNGGRRSYFRFLDECTALFDLRSGSDPISVSELDILWDQMIAETRADHHPHTDLLCLIPR